MKPPCVCAFVWFFFAHRRDEFLRLCSHICRYSHPARESLPDVWQGFNNGFDCFREGWRAEQECWVVDAADDDNYNDEDNDNDDDADDDDDDDYDVSEEKAMLALVLGFVARKQDARAEE